ncbi:MAG: AlpA family transcriptional regulator [Porticoccaceae bacterium]|jgi:prophage regulatory protein|nr:AlpA family transcriptional regulator [Porticoccaceae bacterium]
MQTKSIFTTKILRRPVVEDLTGLSKSAIYEKINKKSPRYDPSFPIPIKLGAGAVGWCASEVSQWIEKKKEARS